jgi:hypothetical protein
MILSPKISLLKFAITGITPKISLLKFAINGIIAPHGITDIIHAIEYNNIPQLIKINCITTGYVFLLNMLNLKHVLNTSFIVFSIIHFRRDFPKISLIPKFILSFISMLYLILNPDKFIYYMIGIHVPNHYKLNWNYLKINKKQNIYFLSLSSLLFIFIGNNFLIFAKKKIVFDLIKSIIISHIIYGELYIYN